MSAAAGGRTPGKKQTRDEATAAAYAAAYLGSDSALTADAITVNPYLGAAMMLAAGLDGIENDIDPGDTLRYNIRLGSDILFGSYIAGKTDWLGEKIVCLNLRTLSC